MAKYEVIETFKDLSDGGKLYTAGPQSFYPKPANKKVTKKRIEELASDKNKHGRPFIREVIEEKEGE